MKTDLNKEGKMNREEMMNEEWFYNLDLSLSRVLDGFLEPGGSKEVWLCEKMTGRPIELLYRWMSESGCADGDVAMDAPCVGELVELYALVMNGKYGGEMALSLTKIGEDEDWSYSLRWNDKDGKEVTEMLGSRLSTLLGLALIDELGGKDFLDWKDCEGGDSVS